MSEADKDIIVGFEEERLGITNVDGVGKLLRGRGQLVGKRTPPERLYVLDEQCPRLLYGTDALGNSTK